ncbi:MAG: RdgB/HAM1 family non-canonical purine NTP pyrophosphatase [Pirellulaceae bacterium]
MSAFRHLILGTHNTKKAGELRFLLEPRGFELQTLADLPNAIEVEEKGTTFAENAAMKASQQARHLKNWVLAEDSGLSVDALGGQPGVFSARFSGQNATDASNNERLLRKLADTPLPKRTARYVCHIALADPAGAIRLECEASCEGRIRSRPAGTAGFGYDPLFEIVEYHRTFGELGDTVKSVLSHRGRALRLLIPQLVQLAESDL